LPEYLEDAESSLRAGNFRGCVLSSQLATENAAKAVVATERAPSWGMTRQLNCWRSPRNWTPNTERKQLDWLNSPRSSRRSMAGLHNGEPERFVTPRMLYDLEAAEKAVALAREAVKTMNGMVKLGGE